jgi:hypothetical protein
MFTYSEAWHVSFDIEQNSVIGMSQFILVNSGFLWIQLVDLSDVVGKGYSLDTLSGYFESLSKEEIDWQLSFGLTVGHAAFIPFGCVAICIGIGGKEENIPFYNSVPYIAVPLLEARLMNACNDATRGEVKAFLTKCMSRKLKLYRHPTAKLAFDTWLKSWPDTTSPKGAVKAEPGSPKLAQLACSDDDLRD